MFRADWGDKGIRDAVSELAASLEEEAPKAVDDCSKLIADDARANHTFENRTGYLQAAIQAGPTTGSFLNGTLTGGPVGDMPYGGFVELRWNGKFAYLGPANERTQSRQSAALERFLQRAVKRSRGWK